MCFNMAFCVDNREGEILVVSRYINNPLLMDGFKFDLRLFVVVTSFQVVKPIKLIKPLILSDFLLFLSIFFLIFVLNCRRVHRSVR